MLVRPRSLCCAFGRARHSETRPPGTTKLLGLPLDELAKNLGERHVSPSRFVLEQREIVAIGS